MSVVTLSLGTLADSIVEFGVEISSYTETVLSRPFHLQAGSVSQEEMLILGM